MSPFYEANDRPPTPEAAIIHEIEKFIGLYATIPDPHYVLPIALWALATHCYQRFDAFGYLVFSSDVPGSGKSRMLEILACVCSRPRLHSKITLAAMSSIIEQYLPTLLIDQAERLSRTEHDDMMACLLSGYRQGTPVTVLYKGEAVERPIYCPKAFALLGDMMEAARDRSIIIPMQTRREKRKFLWREARELGEPITKCCALLLEEHGEEIDNAISNFHGLPGFVGREEEIWMPIFIICELFWPSRRIELERAAADICAQKRAVPRKVSATAAKMAADAIRDSERLMHDLMTLRGPEVGIRTNDALRRLADINNAPWRNYAGVGLTDQKMAELLAYYCVRPRQFKVNGKNLRGYTWVDIEAGLRRVL